MPLSGQSQIPVRLVIVPERYSLYQYIKLINALLTFLPVHLLFPFSDHGFVNERDIYCDVHHLVKFWIARRAVNCCGLFVVALLGSFPAQ